MQIVCTRRQVCRQSNGRKPIVAGSFSFFIAQRCVAKESYFLHRARPMRKKRKIGGKKPLQFVNIPDGSERGWQKRPRKEALPLLGLSNGRMSLQSTLVLTNPSGSASTQVYLHGATVTSWLVNGVEKLFVR